MTNSQKPPAWTIPFILLTLAAMFAAAWIGQSGWNWLLVAIFLCLFLAVLGHRVVGRPTGILITPRNLMSMSRFQMVIWTVIILSGYFTMALARIKAGVEDPLSIALDWHLWALMGISTASLVGTPLLLNSKKDEEPAEGTVAKVADGLGEDKTEIDQNRQGVLYSNPNISDASISDMFQGDELQNTKYLDLAKVQMFLFTLIAATSYAVTLWNTFSAAGTDPGSLETMPGLSDGIIALLGISHTGYLSSKGITRTQTKK